MSLSIPDVSLELLADVPSPALIVVESALLNNIQEMIRVAGSPNRLRPHCKTHKMPAIAQRLLAAGITKHKAATTAEVEMLALAGVRDIVMAYPAVGPTIRQVVALAGRFPGIDLSVTADAEEPLAQLSDAASAAGVEVGVLLDIDAGMHRTGLPPNDPRTIALCLSIVGLPGLRFAGVQLYDGHRKEESLVERRAGVQADWKELKTLLDQLQPPGPTVNRILCGGTPSFPLFAELNDPRIELSPGTCVLHDVGYGSRYTELNFQCAAFVLTRVISKPGDDRVTLDVGNKAVAADPPVEKRLMFPMIPDAQATLQNEEHLVIRTERAADLSIGDMLLAIPGHVCPTSNLHAQATVVTIDGTLDCWPVTARTRLLTTPVAPTPFLS